MKTGRRPLVFIVSDSLSGDSSSRLLFPREVQEELAICNIRSGPKVIEAVFIGGFKLTTMISLTFSN